jgi:hypothetical protein
MSSYRSGFSFALKYLVVDLCDPKLEMSAFSKFELSALWNRIRPNMNEEAFRYER